jgi:hypothetical protein
VGLYPIVHVGGEHLGHVEPLQRAPHVGVLGQAVHGVEQRGRGGRPTAAPERDAHEGEPQLHPRVLELALRLLRALLVAFQLQQVCAQDLELGCVAVPARYDRLQLEHSPFRPASNCTSSISSGLFARSLVGCSFPKVPEAGAPRPNK